MKRIAKILTLALALAGGVHADDGFVPLFNGKNLDGWHGSEYKVEDGVLIATDASRNLVTDRIYANYVLAFSFKLENGGNNGIGINYPGEGDSAYSGLEVQVLDDSAPEYKDLEPGQYHGSIYKLAAAKRGHLKPVGEWNEERITVMGPMVTVELNGTVITKANLDELQAAHPEHEGVKRRSGQIALLGHGPGVSFKDLKIKELPPAANEEGAQREGFTKIFDGSTLKGWKPGKDGVESWVARGGIIMHSALAAGKEADLWSEKSYKDFTLLLDWRWTKYGPMMDRPLIGKDGNETGETAKVSEVDSGVYVRGNSKSQVNLWNWPVGSGEVYGYRTDSSQPAEVRAGVTPSAKADKSFGEWNRMMITMKGERLTVVLNGQTVIKDARLPGVPAEGAIALQNHGADIDFANIWIKEL